MPAVKFIVCGKVQGVFFRASTRDQALQLGLNGYAKNLSDGSVEVVASGAQVVLIDFERWLRKGPPVAQVTSVSRHECTEQLSPGFFIL